MGKLSAMLYVLSHIRTLINGVKATKMLYSLGLLYVLEGLNLIKFLEIPRSRKEILEKLGDVKDMELFNQLIDIIIEIYGKSFNGNIIVDESKLAKIRKLSKHPFIKQFDKMLEAAKTLYPENLLALLQKREPRFDWSELLITFYTQLKAPIYYMGREVVFRFADAKKHLRNKTLLEVGGGFGFETEHILKYFNNEINIIVADFFKEVLDVAKAHEVNIGDKKFALEELDNVEFLLLDPDFKDSWPINDSEVDGVLAYAFLHWTKHPKKFVLETGRVLKPNGIFFGASPLYEETPSDIITLYSRIIGSRGFMRRSEFEEYISEAGFRKLEVFMSAAFKTIKK